MKSFSVIVRTDNATHQYTALAANSIDAQLAAMDRFGPFCKVTVTAA